MCESWMFGCTPALSVRLCEIAGTLFYLLPDFRWEEIQSLPVSPGREKIAFRYCL